MKKSTNLLLLIYYFIYILAIAIAAAGYYLSNKGETFFTNDQSQTAVVWTSIYIIYLIASIPLALKFFNMKVKKLADVENMEEKIKKYTSYSVWRLVAISIGLLAGIFLVYVFHSKSMLFGAAVAAIALVFCKPSEVKMADDLDAMGENDD